VELASSGQTTQPSGRQIQDLVGGRWNTLSSAIEELGGPEKAWEQARTTARSQKREPVSAER
jgi:hypothetical protein